MFEVGMAYRITANDGDERNHTVYTVRRVEMPLIEVEAGAGLKIINTHSPAFVEAEPLVDDLAAERRSKAFVERDRVPADEEDGDDSDESEPRLPPTGS